MSCFIQITDPSKTTSWIKLGSSQDYENIQGLAQNSRASFNLFESLLVPVRTNNLSDFAKDFFLPTTLHYYDSGIQNIALKILVILGSLFLDIATLGFRVVT